jgi:hypothetical protein
VVTGAGGAASPGRALLESRNDGAGRASPRRPAGTRHARLEGAVDPAIVQSLRAAAKHLAAAAAINWDEATAWLVDAEWQTSHFAGGGRITTRRR